VARGIWTRAADVAGKIWNGPNTAVGLFYGATGYVLAWTAYRAGLWPAAPGLNVRHNAIQFTNNPLGGVGAITLGNTTTYADDPYSGMGREAWRAVEAREGHPIWEHERQHTIQGQHLGPLYLPSNVLGGLIALILDRSWHGPHNWNERGPQSHPARPWANR